MGRWQAENFVRVASSKTLEHVGRPPDEPPGNGEPEEQERSLKTGRFVNYRKFFYRKSIKRRNSKSMRSLQKSFMFFVIIFQTFYVIQFCDFP